MFDDQISTLAQRDIFGEQRHDLFRHIEVVEDRHAALIQFDDFGLFRRDGIDIVAHLLIHGLVVHVNAAERPVEQVSDNGRRTVHLPQQQRRRRLRTDIL